MHAKGAVREECNNTAHNQLEQPTNHPQPTVTNQPATNQPPDPHRHVRVHGEALGVAAHRGAAWLCRLRGGGAADRRGEGGWGGVGLGGWVGGWVGGWGLVGFEFTCCWSELHSRSCGSRDARAMLEYATFLTFSHHTSQLQSPANRALLTTHYPSPLSPPPRSAASRTPSCCWTRWRRRTQTSSTSCCRWVGRPGCLAALAAFLPRPATDRLPNKQPTTDQPPPNRLTNRSWTTAASPTPRAAWCRSKTQVGRCTASSIIGPVHVLKTHLMIAD